MKNAKIITTLLLTLVLLATADFAFASPLVIKNGIMIVEGRQLPDLLGTPESNMRFALWNRTAWIELPFWVKEAKVPNTGTCDANGTVITTVMSEVYSRVSEKDVISVKIPSEVGFQAALGEWWETALHLDLENRLSIQLVDDTGYSNVIFVYYQTTGACLPPDYSSAQYSDSPPANGTRTVESSITPATFRVKSFSSPQTVKLVAASRDPTVYSLDNIMTQKFEGTAGNPQPTRPFYLPAQGQAVSGVILKIEGQSYGDIYARALNAYINGQKVWNDNNGQGLYVYDHFSAQKDITSMILNWWGQDPNGNFIVNSASVVLTCYSGYGYWGVRTSIYVVYNANSNFRNVVSNFAQWYQFDTNNYNIVNYTAQLPESIANEANSVVINIHGKAYDDPWSRYLDLYLDNQMIKRWTVRTETVPPYQTCTLDITSYVLGKSGVKVGIQLICGVGHWIIDGNITVKYRPAVAPDGSSFWQNEEHTLTDRAGNLYDTTRGINWLSGIFSFDTRGKERPIDSASEFFTGVTVTVPPPARTVFYIIYSMETHVTITHVNWGLVTSGHYNYMAYGGSSSGSTQAADIGSDLFALLAAALPLLSTDPVMPALFGISAVLVKYVTPPSPSFDYGPEPNGNGVYFKFNNAGGGGVKEKSILFKFSVEWPWVGQYTVRLETTLKIGFCYYGNNVISTLTFVETFTHTYNP